MVGQTAVPLSPDPCNKALYMARSELPKPFLKWAGGKDQLLDHIVDLIPNAWFEGPGRRRYHEPFLGGGAVFFALRRQLGSRLLARLSDRTRPLIDAWLAVLSEQEAVANWIRDQQTSESAYYRIRAMDPSKLDPVTRGARAIYLNKTCFNGLYRVAPHFLDPKKAVFNVPWGKREAPAIFDPANFRAISKCRPEVTIRCCDFRAVDPVVGPGDLIYLDPPYVPITKTSKTAYEIPFGYGDHEELAELAASWVERGAYVLASNSSTPWTRTTWGNLPGFRIHGVEAKRSVGASSGSRGKVKEILAVGTPR